MTSRVGDPAPSETSAPRNTDAYEVAHKRAAELQGLYVHILVFAVINAGLFAINWLTRGSEGPWWFQWPLLGWGIGLAVHLLVMVAPVFSTDWVDRRTERMLAERDRN